MTRQDPPTMVVTLYNTRTGRSVNGTMTERQWAALLAGPHDQTWPGDDGETLVVRRGNIIYRRSVELEPD